MAQFIHPAAASLTLTGVLSALADPMRLKIIKSMLRKANCLSCSEATPCPDMAKSTLSNHFRILREAGLISTTKKGVQHRNTVRVKDINQQFPGLLKLILKLSNERA